jgi:hypothetical protein
MKGLKTFALALAAAAAVARAEVVVQRWGIAGRVQHPGTLSYSEAGEAGKAMRFDLSALPGAAEVYRARLLMSRSGGYGSIFEVYPVEAGRAGEVVPAPEALAPLPP